MESAGTLSRRLSIAALVTAVALVAAGTVSTAAAQAAPSLFVAAAGEGSLRGSQLVLRDVDQVVSFTDRPARRAAELSVRGLVRRWRALGFAADPPNAALSLPGEPTGQDVAILTLSRPRLLAGRRAVAFRVREIEPEGSALERFERRADDRVPARFGRASLFIDPSSGDPIRVILNIGVIGPGQSGSVVFDDVDVTETDWQPFAGAPGEVATNARGVLVAGGATGVAVSVNLTIEGAGSVLTGTASLPGSAGVQFFLPGSGGTQRITNGPFRIPLGG